MHTACYYDRYRRASDLHLSERRVHVVQNCYVRLDCGTYACPAIRPRTIITVLYHWNGLEYIIMREGECPTLV